MEAIRQKHIWIFRLYGFVIVIIQLFENNVKQSHSQVTRRKKVGKRLLFRRQSIIIRIEAVN